MTASETTPTISTVTYERNRESEVELRRLVEAERHCCAADVVQWRLDESAACLSVVITVSEAAAQRPEAEIIRDVLIGEQ